MVNVFDLYDIYKTYFVNKPYFIGKEKELSQEVNYGALPRNSNPRGNIQYNRKNIALNKVNAYGKDVWCPVEFVNADIGTMEIEACTVATNLVKTIIRTPVSERKGTVKECFNIDDIKFTIKGFVIGQGRKFPEEQIDKLKRLFESTEIVELHGGYPEIFLESSCRVAIETLEFPEVQGQAHWIRPFILTCETDYIEDLIIK